MSCLIVLILTALVLGLEWGVTCGILYLITLCFGWEFKLITATGIWLIIVILRSIFKNNSSN